MELTVDQALLKGVEAHKAGDLETANRYYTAILKVQPKHPDANHNIGVLAVALGTVQEALPYFKNALETNPAIDQFWISYIEALINLEKTEVAREALNEAKSHTSNTAVFDKYEKWLQEFKEPTDVFQKSDKSPFGLSGKFSKKKSMKLAKKKVELEKYEEAEAIYREILLNSPENKGAISRIRDLRGFENANKIVNKEPAVDELQNLTRLFKMGQSKKALSEAKRLTFRFPRSATLLSLLGTLHLELRNPEEALRCYKKALLIEPGASEIQYNIARALQRQAKLEDAISAYNKALRMKPDNVDAHYNKGIALQKLGNYEEAVLAYSKVIDIKPEYFQAYRNLGNALKKTHFKKSDQRLHNAIRLLVSRGEVNPRDISISVISLLKRESAFKQLFARVDCVYDPKLLRENGFILSSFPLLLHFMRVCPIADLELEAVLNQLRSWCLFSISCSSENFDMLPLQTALALQCFTNEYVYDYGDAESAALGQLEDYVANMLLRGTQPAAQAVLCLASYKALSEYDWCTLLLTNSDIEEVFTRQILEPKEEDNLSQNIEMLAQITDATSSAVRNQYEKNPYPRWINFEFPLQQREISDVLRQSQLKLYFEGIDKVKKPTVLIAGCGTGQQALGTATKLKDAKVLAIDLSLKSLAYAKRKTKQLGVTNIEYMQADILELEKLNIQFDLVESGGVLHHMNDPMAGWNILTACLKPGGLMRIGLYSECARQEVTKIRDEINLSSISPSRNEMRSFRNLIMKSDKHHHRWILNYADFYCLSELRDLLFHVEEHLFTIPKLKQSLSDLKLKFCGFETPEIVSKFQKFTPHMEHLYDLDKWHAYEKANPKCFAGMYQFWCQKGYSDKKINTT